MKLKPMTDFVLELQDNELMSKIGILAINYANFLKTPLKLEMFVPCDEKGNVLKKPIYFGRAYSSNISEKELILCEEYSQAEKILLFEDFEIATNKEGEKVVLGDYTCLKISDLDNGTIEDLVKYVHIKLTESAVKRIFG